MFKPEGDGEADAEGAEVEGDEPKEEAKEGEEEGTCSFSKPIHSAGRGHTCDTYT